MMARIQRQVVRGKVRFLAHRDRKVLFLYFVTVSLLALAGTSCTTLTVSEYEAPVIDKHTLIERHGGVAVAVLPMQDQGEQDKYFGTSLTDRGVLPISILVRNSSSKSYLLSGNQIRIDSTGKQTTQAEIASDGSADAVDITGAVLISPALIVIGGKMRSNYSVVRHSLEKNELRRTIVSPGGVKYGFIYAPIEKGQKTISITIPLQDMETSLETPYRFRVDLTQ